jgi:transcriptional regulator with XRE-family HTH domain
MDMIELGDAFKEKRKLLGLHQEYIAECCGMSRTTISLFENGKLPELGLRKVIVLFSTVGLALDLKSMQSRPTLNDLVRENDRA